MTKSSFPFRSAEGMDQELQKYFDKLGRQLEAISELEQLDSGAASSEIAAKVNAIIVAAGQR